MFMDRAEGRWWGQRVCSAEPLDICSSPNRSKGGDGTRDPGPLPGFLASFLGLGSLSLDAGLSGE